MNETELLEQENSMTCWPLVAAAEAYATVATRPVSVGAIGKK